MEGKVLDSQKIYVPCKCPNCGSDLEWSGTDLICRFENEKGLPYHFITCISPVDNAGWATYSSIVNGLKSEDDLVDFIRTIDIDRIVNNTNGSVTKTIVRSICDKLVDNVDPIRFLVACNIKGLGWNTCKSILDSYPEFIEDAKNDCINYDKVRNANNVGWTTVETIKEMKNRIKNLADVMKVDSYVKEEKKIAKFKVAITGALSVKRADFDKLLNDHGIEQSGNFKELKYLITNTPNSGSSKNRKAVEYGVTVITEEDFRNMYLND